MTEDEIYLLLAEAGMPIMDEDGFKEFRIEFRNLPRLYDAFFRAISLQIECGEFKEGWIEGYAASMRDEEERMFIQ